jgi:hypothetical protein
MKPTTVTELWELVATLMANSVEQEVRIKILERAILALAKEVRIEEINGMPIAEWIDSTYQQRISDSLVRLENANPEIAARLQQIMDGEG